MDIQSLRLTCSTLLQMREVGEIEGAYQAAMADVETLGTIRLLLSLFPHALPSAFVLSPITLPQAPKEKSKSR